MNCTKCGAPLENDARFCNVCGSPVEAPAPTPAVPQGGYGQGSYVPGVNQGYVPGGNQGYMPGGGQNYAPQGGYAQGGYVPGGNQGGYNPGNQGGGRKNGSVFVESSVVRKYFLSNRTWPTALIIAGIPFICAFGIGIIMIVIGIIFLLKTDYTGEASVDQAWENQIEVLTQRGMDKLNLIDDQVSLIDPVVLVGLGAAPDGSFAAAKVQAEAAKAKSGLFGWGSLFKLFKKKKTDGTEEDPVESYKIGSDERLRSMLLEVTVYRFTESQVLIYCGDVDISTGLVYKEYTSECFYQDIEGMNFNQSLYKVFNRKKKQYVNKVTESLELFLGGCTLRSSVNTEVGASVIDTQFTAMRNLIRDKKNA